MPVPVNYYDTQGTTGGDTPGADDGTGTSQAFAMFGAGAGLASDLLGAFYSSSMYRYELKIRKEEKAITKILADSQFNQQMQALFNAQNDLKDKTTLELETGRKEFKSRQASIAVAASERGQDGQSISDIHNDLTRTHEAFKQLSLIQMGRGERDLMLRRQGIIDQRTAALAGNAISDPGAPSAFSSILSNAPASAIQALMNYRYYMGDSGTSLPDFKIRGEKD